MKPRFDARNGNIFVPDFYLVGGHGCGRLSLSYYLSWLGAPVSPERNPEPTKDTIHLPVLKNPETYLYGLTVEYLSNTLPTPGHENDSPVIWLVRDPVKMLASLYNYFVGDAVFGKGTPEILQDNYLLPFFINHLSFCALYSTLKKITRSRARPFVLQTEDLLADTCVNTLKSISEYLAIPFSSAVCDIANISFNSFENRLWARQPAKKFPINILYYIQPGYYFAPDKIFDFWYNQWSPAKILSSFELEGQNFTIGMPLDQYVLFKNYIPNNYFDAGKISGIKKSIGIWLEHCKVTKNLYGKYSITAEMALDAINSNQKFKSRFLHFMDRELNDFASEYPEIVGKWEYFNNIR